VHSVPAKNHWVSITLPEAHMGEATAGTCAAECGPWRLKSNAHRRCVEACPDVSVTWDERCANSETRQCFEYLTSDSPGGASDEELDAATKIVVGSLAVVGLLVAYAALHEWCRRYSSDPKCAEALSE
jgi:hypothetical protein